MQDRQQNINEIQRRRRRNGRLFTFAVIAAVCVFIVCFADGTVQAINASSTAAVDPIPFIVGIFGAILSPLVTYGIPRAIFYCLDPQLDPLVVAIEENRRMQDLAVGISRQLNAAAAAQRAERAAQAIAPVPPVQAIAPEPPVHPAALAAIGAEEQEAHPAHQEEAPEPEQREDVPDQQVLDEPQAYAYPGNWAAQLGALNGPDIQFDNNAGVAPAQPQALAPAVPSVAQQDVVVQINNEEQVQRRPSDPAVAALNISPGGANLFPPPQQNPLPPEPDALEIAPHPEGSGPGSGLSS